MFGQTTGLAQDGQAVYYLLQFWPEWILALIAFLPVKQWLQSWLEARGSAGQRIALWAPRVLALGCWSSPMGCWSPAPSTPLFISNFKEDPP